MRRPLLHFALVLPFAAFLHCSSDDAAPTSGVTEEDSGTGGGDDGGGTTDPDGGGTPDPDGGGAGADGSKPNTNPVRSVGCGKAAKASPAAGDKHSVKVGAKTRTFLEYIPAGYDVNKNYPLLFTLHGIGATGQEMSEYVEMQKETAGQAVVVFPDGSGGNWDTGGTTDLDFFDAMIDDVAARLCINQQRVYALGFSYGAYMVNHLGCKRADRIRAIAAADGGFGDNPAGCGQTAAIVYHRTDDNDESVANGRAARDKWLSIDKCGTTTTKLASTTNTAKFGSLGCVEYQGCAASAQVAWCEDNVPYTSLCGQDCRHDFRDVYRAPVWQWLAAQQ